MTFCIDFSLMMSIKKKKHLLASALKPVAHGSAVVHEPGPVHEPPQVIGYVSNGKRLELGKLNRSDTAQELKDKILEHMVKHCSQMIM